MKRKVIEKCDTCHKPIFEGQEYTEIEKTKWLGIAGDSTTWFWHDECGGSMD